MNWGSTSDQLCYCWGFCQLLCPQRVEYFSLLVLNLRTKLFSLTKCWIHTHVVCSTVCPGKASFAISRKICLMSKEIATTTQAKWGWRAKRHAFLGWRKLSSNVWSSWRWACSCTKHLLFTSRLHVYMILISFILFRCSFFIHSLKTCPNCGSYQRLEKLASSRLEEVTEARSRISIVQNDCLMVCSPLTK